MINLRTIGITAAVAAVIAWNSVSTTLAYRAGRNAAVADELAEMRAQFAASLARHQDNLNRYDQLARAYAERNAREARHIINLENTLHDHIAENRGTCRLDARSVQLVNALINAANAADLDTAGGNERAYPVPPYREPAAR